MSNYYKIMRDRISQEYHMLRIRDNMVYLVLRIIGLTAVFQTYVSVNNIYKEDIGTTFLIWAVLGGTSQIFAEFWKYRILENRWNKTQQISQDDLITIESLSYLIDELEKNLNNLKTISQWAVGILTTLIVLVSTIIGNTVLKFIDIAFNTLEGEGILKIKEIFIEEYQSTQSSLITVILGNAGYLLLLFILPISVGYLLFSIFSFGKKQMLSILYDVKYHMLLNDNEEDSKFI